MSTDKSAGKPEPVNDFMPADNDVSLSATIEGMLRPLASLKLTVALLSMSIFIVLAGTMAQWQTPTWQVVDEYFRVRCTSIVDFLNTSYVWIRLQIFFPPSFFTSKPEIPGAFPFPKGWIIGFALVLNLLAAHLLRFRVQARGARLASGVGISAAGVLAIALVIAGGSNEGGFQGMPWLKWEVLWLLFLWGVTASCVLCAGAGVMLMATSKRRVESFLLLLISILFALVTVWLWWRYLQHGTRLSDSSMRILWQLAKATAASSVLLVGCIFLFKKRGGIVLLHAGVLLLMFGELLVGLSAREGQMRIPEGQTVNYTYDVHQLELAVVDRSPADHDTVISVSESALRNGLVEHKDLPFNVELVKYFPNSSIRRATPDDEKTNAADQGSGVRWMVDKQPGSSGTDSSGAVDVASAYVRLTTKDGKPIGTYLASQWLSFQDIAEQVTVGDKTYDMYLRFERDYKPYSVHLLDVRKKDYPGTDKPRDYRSIVRLVEDDNNVDRKVHVWMNNPMRYAGETFYQSGYQKDPTTEEEITTLSVVTNMGWMIPYTACMVVAVGMLAHFYVVLMRFLHRKSTQNLLDRWGPLGARMAGIFGGSSTDKLPGRPPEVVTAEIAESSAERSLAIWLPIVLVVLVGGWLFSKGMPPRTPKNEMDLVAFGKLPVVYQGRVKPIDTLARNSLRILSERETFKDAEGARQPATRWFLDLIARPSDAYAYNIFRIQNPELLSSLNLEPRQGHWYSANEILAELDELQKQAALAREAKDMSELDHYQRAVLALEQKLGTMDLLIQSYDLPRIREDHVKEDMMAAIRRQQMLLRRHPPLSIPPSGTQEEEDKTQEEQWECYAIAWTRDVLAGSMQGADPNPATETMSNILAAYARQDAREFNKQVAKYERYLEANTPRT